MQRGTRVFLALVLFLTAALGGMFALVYFTLSKPHVPTVPDDVWLEMRLTGAIIDQPPEQPLLLPGLRPPPMTFIDMRRALQEARDDRRVKGVVLYLADVAVGWAMAQEIRVALQDFRQSGKKVMAYIENGGDREYYLALAADEIYLAPEGTLYLNGLSLEAQFFKETLDKVGVTAEFYHVGEYKSAPDSYTRSSMSEPHKEVLNALADSLYKQTLTAMADGRKLTVEESEAYINDFALAGPRLTEARVIDGLKYFDQVMEGLGAPGSRPETMTLDDYFASLSVPTPTGPKLAVLYVSGEIRSGESRPGGFNSSAAVGSDTLHDALADISEDSEVQGLLVRIDSPGGSALAADLIWRDIMRYKEETQKPVVVSMSDLAASGGYWIATAGDHIVAQPGTLTGSIGVFFGRFNLQGLFDKVGYRIETVSRGKFADMFNPNRPFTEAEVNKVNLWLRTTYDSFLSRVAKARHISPAEADAVARGRVWTGEQALTHKLVDTLGGVDEALKILREKAGVDGAGPVQLQMYPQQDNLFDRLVSQLGMQSEAQGSNRTLQEAVQVWQMIRAQEEERTPEVQARLPFNLRID